MKHTGREIHEHTLPAALAMMRPRKKHIADARTPFACHSGLNRIGSTTLSTSSFWKKNKAAAANGLAVRSTPVARRMDHMDVNAAI